MNKKILFSLLIALFAVSGIALASVASNLTMNNVPYAEWNNNEFDKLAMDTVIPGNNGQVDILQSLSLMNLDSAYQGKGIKDLWLWTDKGDAGFQGLGIDKKIGKAVFDQTSWTWYWKDVDLVVPSTGLRVFVTAETEQTISSKYFVRLVIPALTDLDNDKQFDVGDKGIFMFSGNNGPTDDQKIASDSLMIKSISFDTKAPKVVITNLSNNYQVRTDEQFLISGLSRDQSYSNTKTVKININKEGESNTIWTTVDTDRNNYQKWTYAWTPTSLGKYIIKVKAIDFNDNEMISDGITVEAISSGDVVYVDKTILSVDKTTAQADGKIRINGQVIVKDFRGVPLANKAVEITYVRNSDGYIARDTLTTNSKGLAVWGMPSTVSGNVILTAIVDGKLLNQTLTISYTD